MRYLSFFFICLFLSLGGLQVPVSAQPGRDGARALVGRTVVNTYTYLTAEVPAGTTAVPIADPALNNQRRFAAPLAPGDLLMIHQTTGPNAGTWEWIGVKNVADQSIETTRPLRYGYSTTAQVVRVPRFTTLRAAAGTQLTAEAWNGRTGGILAVEVNGPLTLAAGARCDVSGLGFRGGQPGGAGEGLKQSAGQGGGVPQGGGGGGANGGELARWQGYGVPHAPNEAARSAWNRERWYLYEKPSTGGGRGGYTLASNEGDPTKIPPGDPLWGTGGRQVAGGLGGKPYAYATSAALYLGSGGGGGHDGGRGGAGGGLICLVAQRVVADQNNPGQVLAQGAAGADGAAGGGGGSGGTVLMVAASEISNAEIKAEGGAGGNQTGALPAGPGGGGSGGYVAVNGSLPNSLLSVSGGSAGRTVASAMSAFPSNGATGGALGTVSNATGWPLTSVTDTTTSPVATTPATTNRYAALKKGESLRMDAIRFATNEKALLPGSEATLNELYHFLQDHPKARIEIAGHTDNTGSARYSERLSLARAQTVVDYLMQRGINADRLRAKGYGGKRPAASNSTEAGRRQNRRVEVTLLNP